MTEIVLKRPVLEGDLIDIFDGALSDYESRCNLACTHSWYNTSPVGSVEYSLCFVLIDGNGIEFPVLHVVVSRTKAAGSRVAFTPYDCRGSGLLTQYCASDVERSAIATLRAMGGAK